MKNMNLYDVGNKCENCGEITPKNDLRVIKSNGWILCKNCMDSMTYMNECSKCNKRQFNCDLILCDGKIICKKCDFNFYIKKLWIK